MSNESEKEIKITLEYLVDKKLIIREDTISLFILRYRFPFSWTTNKSDCIKQRPITICLPEEIKDSEYANPKYIKGALHPLYLHRGGKGLIYE